MDAALNLTIETQHVIFHLVREPMTQLSADRYLSRDSILTGFYEPIPSPHSLAMQADTLDNAGAIHSSSLAVSDTRDMETTPIKPALANHIPRHSLCAPLDVEASSANDDLSPTMLRRSWAADSSNMHPIVSNISLTKASKDEPVFLVPGPVCPKKAADRKNSAHSPGLTNGSAVCMNNVHFNGFAAPDLTSSPLPNSEADADGDGQRNRRPSDLSLLVPSRANSFSYNPSLPPSGANSMGDLSELSSAQKHLQPPASPLTSVKHLLDSPLWTQKTRLREAERERRRLIAELEKERNYRDEVENVVAELRTQLTEAQVRATEAESRSTRLTRELAALQDQTDELNMCRAELSVREDEITTLKQRLNSFQDLMSYSRKLEVEKANLQQECADHRQKIEQLSSKLNEVKDRRMVYSEVETLRVKLQDAEAQLAQQLLDRENVEKDARRQHELYCQLKLQQSVAEKRRAFRRRQTSKSIQSKAAVNDAHLSCSSTGDADEIEYEDIAQAPSSRLAIPSTQQNGNLEDVPTSSCSAPNLDTLSAKYGENLGAVLENELHSAQSHIVRLKGELQLSLEQVSSRDKEIKVLTERLVQMTSDFTQLSAQRELSEQAASQMRSSFEALHADLKTLQSRLSSADMDGTMQDDDLVPTAQLVDVGMLLSKVKYVGTGLTEPLDEVCTLFLHRFEGIWNVQKQKIDSLNASLLKTRDSHAAISNELDSSKAELSKLLSQLQQQTDLHVQYAKSKDREIHELGLHVTKLQADLDDSTTLSKGLQSRVDSVEKEKRELLSRLEELKRQSNEKLQSSKQMLDDQTKRLHELENELAASRHNSSQIDECIQTEELLFGSPIAFDAPHFSESLEHLDDISANGPDDELSVPGDLTHTAYEALAADRRGLSDELVRLHDELSEANSYSQQLEQQIVELHDKLSSTEEELQRQTTLLTRAQENWAIVEREGRETEARLSDLRAEYTAELEAMRAELLPQINRSRSEASATAAQADAVRAKFEVERNELKNKLAETTCELERLDGDRNRLAERNADLQRELSTIRSLMNTVAQNMSAIPSEKANNSIRKILSLLSSQNQENGFSSVADSLNRIPSQAASHINPSLEEWLECACEKVDKRGHRSNTRHRSGASLRGDDLYDHSDTLSDGDSSQSYTDGSVGPSRPPFYDDNLSRCSSHRTGSYRHRHRRKERRASNDVIREIARLTSRTAALETVALNLKQNIYQQQSLQQQTARQRASFPVASSTLCPLQHRGQLHDNAVSLSMNNPHSMDDVPGARSSSLVENGPAVASAPVFGAGGAQNGSKVGQELDTSADSSAYTDLSQVSPASRNGSHSNTSVSPPPAFAEFPKPSTSQALAGTHVVRSGRDKNVMTVSKVIDVPNSARTVPPGSSQDSPPLSDIGRITELHRRNRLQPLHLRTSYPVETQTVNPVQIADALAQVPSSNEVSHLKTDSKSSMRPYPRKASAVARLPVVPEDHGNILREVDKGNMLGTHRSARGGASRSGLKPLHFERTASDEPESRPSPLAAGYHPVPKNLQAIADALLAVSDDPSTMADALAAELSRTALIAPQNHHPGVPSFVPDTNLPQVSSSADRNTGGKTRARTNHERTSNQVIERPEQGQFIFIPFPNGKSAKQQMPDENFRPLGSGDAHASDQFVKPAPPRKPNARSVRNSSRNHSATVDSDDDHSIVSSVHSGKSSVAFEISFTSPTNKSNRRLPPTRVPASSIIVHRGRGTRHHSGGQRSDVSTARTCSSAFSSSSCAKLPLATTIPTDRSFQSVQTPLQRHPDRLK
ncbi:unnamed protein product [Calicophoron daubneyi]|uniref:Uncharacterized protein n=1 Tax=Calicophoron daubneyi TaxID=300641 RepID=A0AAV2TJP5_CALDB